MTSTEIVESFNNIQWHDSKLRSFGVAREADQDNVVLHLELRGFPDSVFTTAILTLCDATYLKAEVDLDGKFQCSDDISSAGCETESSLKEELLRSQLKYSPTALDGYYLFDIYLIPPGGRIQVFARTFELKRT